MRSLGIAIVGSVLLLGSSFACAGVLDFRFSFTDDGHEGFFFETPGTVTGEIIGLTNNATSPAAAVFIDSAPAALSMNLLTPYDTTDAGSVVSNTFTVSGGNIVDADYDVNGATSAMFLIFALSDSFNYVESANGLVTGDYGLAGANFTAVPEPSTWMLTLLGLLGAAFAARGRHQRWRSEQPGVGGKTFEFVGSCSGPRHSSRSGALPCGE